jgi:hypothetical protein
MSYMQKLERRYIKMYWKLKCESYTCQGSGLGLAHFASILQYMVSELLRCYLGDLFLVAV